MIEVIPALMPLQYADLRDDLSSVRGVSRIVQLDVCDGAFVQNHTFPYHFADKAIWQEIVAEKQGLPFWEDFDFEADLMVRHPAVKAREWVSAGASRLVFHSASDTLETISALLKEFRGGVSVGLALPANAPESLWKPFADSVDFFQVMGIQVIGFQGQPFTPEALETIAAIRLAAPELPISVDGAVSLQTAPQLVAAGATRLVVGSALLNADNPRDMIQKLRHTGESKAGAPA